MLAMAIKYLLINLISYRESFLLFSKQELNNSKQCFHKLIINAILEALNISHSNIYLIINHTENILY